jgi:methionyl-tRNA formyltransferase|tara:strand:+ start:32 stop:1030 length:999 start_codon:yes stop_codon:yes gene_type:complete
LSKALRIIFAGTPDFAAEHLAALIKSQHQVVAVYCPPDKPAGRGKKLTACATKELALANKLIIEQPVNFKEQEVQQQLISYNADVMVVVAYGLLLPEVVLSAPKLGCINVHGSILPKWRGAAPIQRSLEAGDNETGVTLMQMDKGLDTGAMILIARCAITSTDTSASLYQKLAKLGPNTLLEGLNLMGTDNYPQIVQDNNNSTYAAKLDKNEAELNWQLTAEVLDRKIRAYIPWPVAQFTFIDKKNTLHKIKVWQASIINTIDNNQDVGTIIAIDKKGIVVSTGQGGIRLETLQLPGKKALPVKDIINGRADWFKAGQLINGFSDISTEGIE